MLVSSPSFSTPSFGGQEGGTTDLSIKVGAVATLDDDANASVRITGTYPNFYLNFGVPANGDPNNITPTNPNHDVYYLGVLPFKPVSQITKNDLTPISNNDVIVPQTVYQHKTGVMGNKTIVLAIPSSLGTINTVRDSLGVNLLGVSYEKTTALLTVDGKTQEYVICGCSSPTLLNDEVRIKFNIV